ncbi:MAG: hypothetical protein ACR2KT_09615, partial [Methylocella sp.]
MTIEFFWFYSHCHGGTDWVLGISKNTPSARPANQIQRISLNLTNGSGAMGQLGFFDLRRR